MDVTPLSIGAKSKKTILFSKLKSTKMNTMIHFREPIPASLKFPPKNIAVAGGQAEKIYLHPEATGTRIKIAPAKSKIIKTNPKLAGNNTEVALPLPLLLTVKSYSIRCANLQNLPPKGQAANPKGASSQPQTTKNQKPKANCQLLTAFLLLVMLLASSCVKHSQLLYFRNQSEFVPLQGHEIANQLRIKIQTDDVLFIMVRALDQETAEPFNLFGGAAMQGNQMAVNNPSLQGYLVDPNGNIDIPVLGRLNVAGKTVEETKLMLVERLKPFLNDPVILIRFLNFRFTVLGEVGAPNTISVPGERMTILEALGQAGDLTPYSNREKIMVIRENNNVREFGYINIHSPEVFQSPYFYLQQNDIVYVEPIKEATAEVRDPISEVLPIISGLLSIAAILIAFTR